MFSGLHFGSPFWLWGLLALPGLAGLFLWAERQATVRMARLIQTPRLRAQLTGANSAARRRGRYGLLLLALGALIFTLAAPQWGYETRETHRRGLDLLVLVDVSKSMLATDLPPTRLARAKLAVQDFVTQLQGDRVGLVAFAGTAFLQAPLTVDYDAVLTSVNDLDTDTIPRGGTDLGGAIDLAVDAFGKAEAGNRAILLLSDGEPTVEGEAAAGVKAAQHAAEAGVRVYTLGFGTPEGSLIPLGSSGNFVRDADGKIVRTKLDEGALKDVARAGNGFYTRFNGQGAIQTVIRQGLGHLKAGEIDAKQTRRPIERYQWPLGAGLVLLAAASFLGERRRVRAPLSPGPRAVPLRTRTPARAAVATVVLLGLGGIVPFSRAEEKPAASNPDALELYKSGHYDEAYKAFQNLAEKNPQQESLQFNAGASAYKGKQYEEALNAFSKAMTSNNVDLQAKANYNFANTLFRRGADKPDRDAKIADWKNALEHYDATLNALKQRGPQGNQRLSTDTAFNRELVKKQLDELMKEPPPPPQDQKDKKDQKDQKNDDKQQSKEKNQSKQDKGKDQDKSKGDSSKPDQSGQDSQGSKPDQNQPGQGGQPSPSQDGQKEGNQPPQPSPGDQGQKGSEGDKKDASGQGGKDMPPDPNENKGREHGDFKAQAGNQDSQSQPATPQPGEGAEGKEGKEGRDEPGKMNAAQARALLDSLKGEDAHVTLGGDQKRQHSDDDPPPKDW